MFPYTIKNVLPAITLHHIDDAVSIAEALHAGGIPVIEIAFRTPVAGKAISAIRAAIPGLIVGAGTLLEEKQLYEAMEAGAHFGLSPGWNARVAQKAKALAFPFIPGVMTPGEIEQALEASYKLLKLFPATTIGGLPFLRALQGPYAHTGIKFIPMGGVDPGNMADYLQAENVAAVGGSWLTPEKLLKEKNFPAITALARQAVELKK